MAHCARKVRQASRDNLVPWMGVLGAFVFAAQMINFPIPGTGSSGHLGGGLLLAILLGPHAAFLVIASVLTVQAFFFADGGLLALGCNMFNLGFFPAFIAYPLLYKPLVRAPNGTLRAWVCAGAAAVGGLQLGALGVVLETTASGITELPTGAFILVMLPIHLAIGVIEGLVTAAVVSFVARVRPEVLQAGPRAATAVNLRPILVGLVIAAAGVGGWFASARPDGLEWSIARVSGKEEIPAPDSSLRNHLSNFQEKTALLPGYGFRSSDETPGQKSAAWPAVSAGASVSGIVGGLITVGVACLLGVVCRAHAARHTPENG